MCISNRGLKALYGCQILNATSPAVVKEAITTSCPPGKAKGQSGNCCSCKAADSETVSMNFTA